MKGAAASYSHWVSPLWQHDNYVLEVYATMYRTVLKTLEWILNAFDDVNMAIEWDRGRRRNKLILRKAALLHTIYLSTRSLIQYLNCYNRRTSKARRRS